MRNSKWGAGGLFFTGREKQFVTVQIVQPEKFTCLTAGRWCMILFRKRECQE